MGVSTTSLPNPLIEIITSTDDAVRNQSLESVCATADLSRLMSFAADLDQFWRDSDNLYHRVRAMFFLSAIYRYYAPRHLDHTQSRLIPFHAYCHLLERRFPEAIDILLDHQKQSASDGIASALAVAYHQLAFQTLANQVRRSVRTVRGNQWMFRAGHPMDHPLRIQSSLATAAGSGSFPVLTEQTAVRMDFTHSGWSDIFFLGMDFPAGAQVLNASINLGVRGRDANPRPPIQTYLRVIDRPVLRLVSVDLNAHTEVTTIPEVFDFARDYLGLLKAAVIASGIVPPGMEGCQQPIGNLLQQLLGPGKGLELVSHVNDIPKGSRLAVSTNLLGSLISICMRATGQVSALQGPLQESDRRLVAARAILGEWIGGSGGGWQDSGGVWPGIKLIAGVEAAEGDPEHGISRGRLLPQHTVLGDDVISEDTRKRLKESLVLVHGGMAQNVGPILEMVTEKYLLRSPAEWEARQKAIDLLQEVVDALKAGDIRALGDATTRNFFGPLQTIIPWCTNYYTNTLIEKAREKFGDAFWGFWMLGGMAGGGMGFIFDPAHKTAGQDWLAVTMKATKDELQKSLPFAMDPVVYDFDINDNGTYATLLESEDAALPGSYYALMVPGWLRSDNRDLSPQMRAELERLGDEIRNPRSGVDGQSTDSYRRLMENILPQTPSDAGKGASLDELLNEHGFDRKLHEQIREELKSGRIGLSQNRLAETTTIEDVALDDIYDLRDGAADRNAEIGRKAIADGQVAVMTLAAGVGSRWTEGAGVVKALHPFCRFGGTHRSFLEVHLAKSRKVGRANGCSMPHIFTTGYLTHQPIADFLAVHGNYGYAGDVILSPGRSVGLRMIPMVRDLKFAWEEMPQQKLDAQQERMRTSLRAALANWAQSAGEGSDYRDNLPMQCMHPVGHWYEFPNLLRNGALHKLLAERPSVKFLMLHNVDTVGADVDAGVLGQHIENGDCLSFEVINRRLEDRGGGLARVNGKLRMLEGLAMPSEADEFKLTFYSTNTSWIDIDKLLDIFGLTRSELGNMDVVNEAIRRLSFRIPTYITTKDVKKRWGHGQEDIFPVSQFEKLWGDMTALPEVSCGFFAVPMQRGAQLKEQAQLDGWLRDGSAAFVESLCEWT